jgi:carboxylesterase type B
VTGSAAHVVLRVRLPDRPGALGAVASRIGALGADITDVTVTGRSPGLAVDVFHLSLPPANGDLDLMVLLRDELAEVDGVRIESWHTASCCRSG